MQLKYKGFKKIVYNEYVSKMVNYLQEMEESFDKQILEVFSTDEDFLNEYNKIVSPISDILEKKKKEKRN